MRKRVIFYLVAIPGLLFSCSNKLLNPLKGSKISGKNGHYYANGNRIILEPKNTLNVKAITGGKIVKVIQTTGPGIVVITKGEIMVGYGNLEKSYVVEGDSIGRGQLIGKLFTKDSVFINSLEIILENDGKPILPNW